MPTFEITQSTFKKTFTGSQNGKEFAVYELGLKDGEGFQNAELVQLMSTPKPEPGETIDGTIEFGPYGGKIKRSQAPGAASKGTGGGYGKSDTERAEIRRSVAIKAAIALLAMEIQSGLVSQEDLRGTREKPGVKASELLKPRIDYFYSDLTEAGKAA